MPYRIAIVGLGNPGDKYKDTRHNAGFSVLDNLAQDFDCNYWKQTCGSLLSQVKTDKIINSIQNCDVSISQNQIETFEKNVDQVLLVKPLSFMNLSGSVVANVVGKYKIKLENLIVVHDDKDITEGNIKIKKNCSHAGHNGLKSIDEKLKSRDYVRVRIGVGGSQIKGDLSNYVLGVPRGQSKELFLNAQKLGEQACISLLFDSLDKVQQRFNSR